MEYFNPDIDMAWYSDKAEKRIYTVNPSQYGGTNPHAKAVVQLDLTGKFIATYPTVKEAAANTGSIEQSICRCAKGNGHSACGYKWMYKSDYDKLISAC